MTVLMMVRGGPGTPTGVATSRAITRPAHVIGVTRWPMTHIDRTDVAAGWVALLIIRASCEILSYDEILYHEHSDVKSSRFT